MRPATLATTNFAIQIFCALFDLALGTLHAASHHRSGIMLVFATLATTLTIATLVARRRSKFVREAVAAQLASVQQVRGDAQAMFAVHEKAKAAFAHVMKLVGAKLTGFQLSNGATRISDSLHTCCQYSPERFGTKIPDKEFEATIALMLANDPKVFDRWYKQAHS
jgi:hypothetical protein